VVVVSSEVDETDPADRGVMGYLVREIIVPAVR
jgi:hypothetical protein